MPVRESPVQLDADSASNGDREAAATPSQPLPGSALPSHEVVEVAEVVDLETDPAKRKSPLGLCDS